MAFYCLSLYNNKPDSVGKGVEVLNISLQILAATSSTVLVILSRSPKIWENVSIDNIKKKYAELDTELKGCSRKRKGILIFIGLFGVLSCVSRGLSAYLGTEVILHERLKVQTTVTIIVQWLVAVTVTVSALCFNLSNMLTSAAKFLKEPSLKPSVKVFFAFIAILTGAIVTRFFIKEFLHRRDASEVGQIIGQGVFFLAEFIMGLFTMGASYEGDWWTEAKKQLGSSKVFSTIVIADVVSTWLGYASITLYSILTDLVIAGSVAHQNDEVCPADQTSKDFALRVTFLAIAYVVSMPLVVAYFNYLLKYTMTGFETVKKFAGSPKASCRLFCSPEETDEPLLADKGEVNMGPV